jgi:hypothetical protein
VIRRTLQRCSTIGRPLRGEGAELAEQVARIPFHEGAQLCRAGDPAGGRERFGHLGWGEITQRSLVDALRVDRRP